jgi:exodeoxyribonuclease VII small subunit
LTDLARLCKAKDSERKVGHIVTETSKKKLELEKAMGELETVVEQLEAGELTLDKSLKQFEKGVRLSRECQQALAEAEQKVQMLMNSELKDIGPGDLDKDK